MVSLLCLNRAVFTRWLCCCDIVDLWVNCHLFWSAPSTEQEKCYFWIRRFPALSWFLSDSKGACTLHRWWQVYILGFPTIKWCSSYYKWVRLQMKSCISAAMHIFIGRKYEFGSKLWWPFYKDCDSIGKNAKNV